MFLSHEKHEGIVVKMIWHWSDILHPQESYTDQYTHLLGPNHGLMGNTSKGLCGSLRM